MSVDRMCHNHTSETGQTAIFKQLQMDKYTTKM